jgi:monoamine oxidase
MIGPEIASVPSRGLGSGSGNPKRIIVIGAGIAGLTAAVELAQAGHDPIVVEAQQRVGGRIYTLRSFAPGLYAEAGAMRIPRTHDLTLAYCQRFGLGLRPFVTGNPAGLVHIAGVRLTTAEARAQPDRLPFTLSTSEQGKHPDDLWTATINDIRKVIESDGTAGWIKIAARYDQYSLYEFLRSKGWSDGAIEGFTVLNFLESDLQHAVMEVLREDLGGAYQDMQEIVGGFDLLPRAMYHAIEDRVRLAAEVVAIGQDESSVQVRLRSGNFHYTLTGDYAICTLPFSVLRHVEVSTPFSREKQRAIRQLPYHASTKILVQVRHRRWETEDGILGGGTVTDMPIRRINYPTPDPTTNRGVLLASYTWGQDALQWGAMDEETRLEEALDNVAYIHPWIREEFEGGASHAWYGDRWTRGAFALFAPDQQTQLHEAIVRPEGRILFAGEHCSLYHAWIQGAVESGIRAALEIHRIHEP